MHRSPDDRHFLVLLRLTFVNPATRGRTVGYMRCGMPDSATVAQPPHEYEEGHDTLKYWIPSTAHVEAYLSEDETLLPPLDIPPQQSRSKWYALLVRMNDAVKDFDIPIVRVEVFADDIFRNNLAKYDEKLELKTHTVY